MPPADMTTQRAYTLRLRPVDAKDDRWREQLWQTHKTVNRGARVFGDFLLTLRGGLSHELAATEDGAQRRQRGKGPEQGNADVETRRKYQRRLLALSWLSVESEEGAPSEYKLGDQESPVGALRDILSKRGLSGAEIEYWVADCQPTLEATIRDDACWVNRAEAFEHYEEAVGGCTEEEVWDFLAFFLGTPSRYTAPLAPLPGSTKHSEGEDEEDPRQVSQDPGKTRARDPDQGPKDLVQKAGQWLSARFGTGKGADFTRIADAYRRIAEWATHTDPSSLSSGAKALLALAAHLGVSVRKGDGLTAVLSLISGPGHKSKTRNRLRNINAQHRPVNTEDMASLAQDAAADSGDCRAKVDRKGGRSYADRILRAVEQATGMSYLQSGGPARHYEMAVMLDHAARRVSVAHTWIKRAEEQRLGPEPEGAVLEAAQVAELLEGFGEAQGGALVEADALRDLGEREALVGFAERVEDCQRALDGRNATFIGHGLPHDCCFPLLGLSHASKNPLAGAETAGPAAARGPAFGDGAGVDMVKRCFASQN